MNRLLLTGLLAAGTISHAQSASTAGQKNEEIDYSIFYDQGEYRDPTFIESTDPCPKTSQGSGRYGRKVSGDAEAVGEVLV